MGNGKTLLDTGILIQLEHMKGARAHEMGVTGRLYTIRSVVREFKAGPEGDAGWKKIQPKFQVTVLPDPKRSHPVYQRAIKEFKMTDTDALLVTASIIRRMTMATRDNRRNYATNAQQLGAIVKLSKTTRAIPDRTDPSRLVRHNPPPTPIREPRSRPRQESPRGRPETSPSGKPTKSQSGTQDRSLLRPPSGAIAPAKPSVVAPPTKPPTTAPPTNPGGAIGGALSALNSKMFENIRYDVLDKAMEFVEKNISKIRKYQARGEYVLIRIGVAEPLPHVIDPPSATDRHAELWGSKILIGSPVIDPVSGFVDLDETLRRIRLNPDPAEYNKEASGRDSYRRGALPSNAKLNEYDYKVFEPDHIPNLHNKYYQSDPDQDPSGHLRVDDPFGLYGPPKSFLV